MVHEAAEVLVKSITRYTPPAYPWLGPSATRSELVGQPEGVATTGDWLDGAGAAEVAGADAVTMTVLAGAVPADKGGWLDDEAQPTAAAIDITAAAAAPAGAFTGKPFRKWGRSPIMTVPRAGRLAAYRKGALRVSAGEEPRVVRIKKG